MKTYISPQYALICTSMGSNCDMNVNSFKLDNAPLETNFPYFDKKAFKLFRIDENSMVIQGRSSSLKGIYWLWLVVMATKGTVRPGLTIDWNASGKNRSLVQSLSTAQRQLGNSTQRVGSCKGTDRPQFAYELSVWGQTWCAWRNCLEDEHPRTSGHADGVHSTSPETPDIGITFLKFCVDEWHVRFSTFDFTLRVNLIKFKWFTDFLLN